MKKIKKFLKDIYSDFYEEIHVLTVIFFISIFAVLAITVGTLVSTLLFSNDSWENILLSLFFIITILTHVLSIILRIIMGMSTIEDIKKSNRITRYSIISIAINLINLFFIIRFGGVNLITETLQILSCIGLYKNIKNIFYLLKNKIKNSKER